MKDAFICDAIRTPIGRYAGGLSSIRTDDLGALPLKSLMARNPSVDWAKIDDMVYGCANQAGEDNRNIARMSALLAGLPIETPATTVNRLCGSGIDAVGIISRGIKAGELSLAIAGGVEGMSRAPFVMPKAETPFSRSNIVYDTTIGWRFPNKKLHAKYGTHSMPETADNVAEKFNISRIDQDKFALRSQQKWATAQKNGLFADEIIPVNIPQRRGEDVIISCDEHPRPNSNMDKLTKLGGINGKDLSVTAGNSSGVNDGACALLMADQLAISKYNLTPKVKVVAMATAGVAPEIMGIGPVPAVKKIMAISGLKLDQMDVIELNEAFAAQGLAVLRQLGLDENDPRINPNGGAIAMGHPLGMSGARLITTAMWQLIRTGGKYGLCTMCIGVGQGIAIIIERIES